MCHPYGEGDELGSLVDRVRRLEVLLSTLATSHGALEKHITALSASHQAAKEVSNTIYSDPGSPHRQPSPLEMDREELASAERRDHNIHSDGRPPPKTDRPLEGGLTRGGTSWYGALALPSLSQLTVDTKLGGEKFEVGSNIPLSPASVRMATLIAEGGASPTVVHDLFNSLPRRGFVERLVQVFFCHINFVRYGLHEQVFRVNCEELFRFVEQPQFSGQALEGAHFVPFMSTLFMILAITHASLPENECTDEQARIDAMRLYHAGRKCIEIGKHIRNEHIDFVVAEVLASSFCFLFRYTSDAWMHIGMAVRDAQAMGLHRDGSKLGLDARTTERRRRLWALVYYHERHVSILVSRPSAIQDKHCDTAPPSDVDIEHLSDRERASIPKHFTVHSIPGVYSCLCYRQAVARIMGEMLELFQDVTRTVRYRDVLEMDTRLAHFLDDLPHYLRPPNDPLSTRNLDVQCPFLQIQRCKLHTIRPVAY